MHEERVGLQVGQNVLPFASGGGATKDADLALLLGTPDIAGHAGIDVRLICHATFLLLCFCCNCVIGPSGFTPPI